MSKIIKELIQFFTKSSSVTSGLENYIASRNPSSVAEVETLARQYMNRGVCGRTS